MVEATIKIKLYVSKPSSKT